MRGSQFETMPLTEQVIKQKQFKKYKGKLQSIRELPTTDIVQNNVKEYSKLLEDMHFKYGRSK